jgi:AraC-like DNA-binding protein
MNIQTIQPCFELQPYIDFFYLIHEEDEKFLSTHFSFPHVANVISIYKEADYIAKLGEVKIFESPENKFLSLVQSKCQVPLKVTLIGRTDRISIFFKSLGLNHFVNVPISTQIGKIVNRFTVWDNDASYLKCLEECFNETDDHKRIRRVEKFLISKLDETPLGYIEKAVTLLADFETEKTIEEIAGFLHVSNRTFNRHFKQMVGVSPAEYRNIARFRHSLNNKLFSKEFQRLTDVAYNSNFYDQSYFTRIYKKLTGSNPATFFQQVEKLGDDKLIFRILKK